MNFGGYEFIRHLLSVLCLKQQVYQRSPYFTVIDDMVKQRVTAPIQKSKDCVWLFMRISTVGEKQSWSLWNSHGHEQVKW